MLIDETPSLESLILQLKRIFQDLSTSFTKFQDAVEQYTKGLCHEEQKSASASPEEIQSDIIRSPKLNKVQQ